MAIGSGLLLLLVVVGGFVLAERTLPSRRGDLQRDKSERNAMSRVVTGLTRWPGSGGGGL